MCIDFRNRQRHVPFGIRHGAESGRPEMRAVERPITNASKGLIDGGSLPVSFHICYAGRGPRLVREMPSFCILK
jgi:hypothetical protein